MDKTLVMNLPRTAQEIYLMGDELVRGAYGKPGEPFFTTRRLAELRGVSIVTAQHIMVGLRDQGLIQLRGKKYFLTYEEQARQHKNQTRLIGVLVPNIQNEFHAAMTKAIKLLALKQGYRVLVMDTAYSREQERTAIELLEHFGVAGIISCPCTAPEGMELYRDCPVPCVLLSHTLEGVKRSSVQVNSVPITQRVAKHLVEEGYRSFLYMGTKMLRLVDDERYMGFRTGLQREGYNLEESATIRLMQNFKADRSVIWEALKGRTEPVGIFCYHDLIAAEVYRVCYQNGLRIPQDVGIVGFDDLPIATSVYPSLTTVQYRITSMAEIALQQLQTEIETGEHKYDNYYLEPNFIVRESTRLTRALQKEAEANKKGE